MLPGVSRSAARRLLWAGRDATTQPAGNTTPRAYRPRRQPMDQAASSGDPRWCPGPSVGAVSSAGAQGDTRMTRQEVLGPYAPDTVLTKVQVYSRDLVYIRAIIRPLDERGVDHTLILRWAAGEWGQFMVPHVSTSFCVIDEPERKVLTLCANGTVHAFSQNGSEVEAIRADGHHLSSQRTPSEIRRIGGQVYV